MSWKKRYSIGMVWAGLAAGAVSASFQPEPSWFQGLEYRCIGPFRGGRSAAVTGVNDHPMLYYFGATGGGVWKTTDGGGQWTNISDGYFGGSIGAVTVSEWDPNVIYVGGGEKTVRGNVSHGYGVWKSTDGGASWVRSGLEDSRRISRIRIHPKDPDLVYAAVMGHLFGPHEERGVYKSVDGGKTWRRVLFVNPQTGAVDLIMDPGNPRILYASLWRVLRTPYSLESGGEGSGLWKSTDGGETWRSLSSNPGMPEGPLGIIGIAVSPVSPERVWAIIEAPEGGVFRSDDGGSNWKRINAERKLRQRAWYYTRIYADPLNEDGVYVLNVQFWRSRDGGHTYESIRTPHGDHHDLWIDPQNPLRMIVGDDGGAQVSMDGGQSWSTYYNQPTAQFYRVITDNHFPYRIYGAQQDNSTVRIAHRTGGRAITERDWEPTAGGESGWLAPHPLNPEIVYGGSYGGLLVRRNHTTDEVRDINVWPDNPMGHGAKDLRYRFQWNFPIFFSPHDPNILYTAGNHLFKTTDEGQSWQIISPDLTRNDPLKLGPSGGPITKDNTSVEYYCTIFAAAESPVQPGILWAGSDDGLIHVSRDHGKTWENVTPSVKIMPEWIQINSIEAHPFIAGGLYVAATMYKSDDFRPYLYKTTDYGKTWKKIVRGIDERHFTRVIRADRTRPGLLFCGTESGIYISFNDGDQWMPFQRNLPVVPVTDLTLKDHDLIVATQGRSFWVMDDITPLHHLVPEVTKQKIVLFPPRPAWRLRGGRYRGSLTAGENAPGGVILHYGFHAKPDKETVQLKILDAEGRLIQTFSSGSDAARNGLFLEAGLNRFVWDMRYPGAESFPGMILWGGGTQGPPAVPGMYEARLRTGEDSVSVMFEIKADPRSSTNQDGLEAQFGFLIEIRDKLTETHRAVMDIRRIREQIVPITDQFRSWPGADSVIALGQDILKRLRAVEEALYQTKNQSRQDPLNYPIRLNNRLSALA
ncbi:MAG TPA: glycosyl hydrolase, partial [bacterium]|nr:glycosyl hydrolase [bacterium]